MSVDVLARDVVMVEGADAATYLHSQLSQEVRDLAVGQSRWSLLLHPTGRVDVLARVLRSGDHGAIARWRAEEQQRRTRERRPDLWTAWLAGQDGGLASPP